MKSNIKTNSKMEVWEKALAAMQTVQNPIIVKLPIKGGFWVVPGEGGDTQYDWDAYPSYQLFAKRYHTYSLLVIQALLDRGLIEPSNDDHTVYILKSSQSNQNAQ